MKAYDAAKENPEIKFPAKHIQAYKGYYRCCIYKWQKQRKSQMWDTIARCAPKIAKKCKEIPNSVRLSLGKALKFGSRAKSNDQSTTTMLPAELQELVAETVVTWPVQRHFDRGWLKKLFQGSPDLLEYVFE